jgi:transcriptional regulator with XRE-family HTH domain
MWYELPTLRALRHAALLSQQELALRANLSSAKVVGKLERGQTRARPSTVRAIAFVLADDLALPYSSVVSTLITQQPSVETLLADSCASPRVRGRSFFFQEPVYEDA